MTVRALDDNGDIVTSGSHFLYEEYDIAQTIKTRLRLFYGEYFRDTSDGTRWFEDVLGKGQTTGTADSEIRRRISQTDGVSGIISYSSDFDIDTRTLTVNCTVQTEYSELEIVFNG